MARNPFAPDAPEKKSRTDYYYDDKFNRANELKQLEDPQSIRDNNPDAIAAREGLEAAKNSEDVQKQEESPTYPHSWDNKTSPQNPRPEKKDLKARLSGLKKKGPLSIIITLLIGGAFGIVSLLTPSLLVIHMSEVGTENFNAQEGSMTRRTQLLLAKKLSSATTSGVCSNLGNIRCRLRTLNEKQFKDFEKAGIKVITTEDATLTGRYKPVELQYKDIKINEKNIKSVLNENAGFRNALHEAYNPKLAGFADKVWGRFSGIYKITKSTGLAAAPDDEARDAVVEETTKNGNIANDAGGRWTEEGEGDDRVVKDESGNEVKNPDGSYPSSDEVANHNTGATIADEVGAGAKVVEETGKKEGGSLLSQADNAVKVAEIGESAVDGAFSASANNLLNLTGVVDTACSVYGAVQAVSYGAKLIRVAQLARYSMLFLSTASKIKAGVATPEEVAYLANILTKTVSKKGMDDKGKEITITSKAATDSWGWDVAINKSKVPMTASASQYLAGGGLGGELSGVTNKVMGYFPGGRDDANKTCKFLGNPFVQGGSLIGGIALMLVPGGAVAIGTKDLAIGGLLLSVSAAAVVLPGMLKDMVAGVLIDDQTYGEAAGDAFISGTGALMSGVAGIGGNAPLKVDQAVAYAGVQNQVIAQTGEEDRLTRSPLDPTSTHTFMGQITTRLLPLSTQTTSPVGAISTSFSIVQRSLASIILPRTSAAEEASYYTQCQDIDYDAIGLATDPFCNPIRGIPPEYLEMDPEEVVALLENDFDNGTPSINESGVPAGNYAKFIEDCITRTEPLGYVGQDFKGSDGQNCFIDSNLKAAYYLFQIDLRVLDGMENGYVFGDVNCGPTSSGGGPNEPTADAINARIAASEATNGWATGTSPLGGKGQTFIDLGHKYGINPGIAVAVLQRESQIGTAKNDVLIPQNNFGGNTAVPGSIEGDCGVWPAGDETFANRKWKKFCTPEAGLEGLFQNLDAAHYRETDGTLGAVMEIYAPRFENDWTDMLSIFKAVGEDLNMTIDESTQIYTSGGGGGGDCRTASGGGAGFAAIWGGEPAEPTMYAFGVDSANGLYGYGTDYGLNGLAHTGIDVVLPEEAPLYSPVSGTVTCAGTGNGPGAGDRGCTAFNDYFGHGNGKIEIEMDNGDVLILGHTSTSLVKVGDKVTPGQQVGTCGGMNSWHVHVEYRVPNSSAPSGYKIVNPEEYLDGVTRS